MATYTIYITLLSVLFVLHLPCPLAATAHDQIISDTVEEFQYQQCYERCVMREHRFPCPEGSYECGDCLYPITSLGIDRCEVIPDNELNKQRLLDIINKRDEGTGLELDTGDGEQPPVYVPDPLPNQDQVNDIGAEQNQANPDAAEQEEDAGESPEGDLVAADDPAMMFRESNAEVEAHETEPNNGSVILLEEWQFILIVVGCVAVAIIGVATAFICWYKIQTTSKAQNEADYPSYGVTGPGTQISSSMNNGDRKLAQSAQMYHYQHQKQQMIAMEKREKGEVQRDASDYDSEEENEDGDLTVYECPGLAPTGEMQVKNPLFAEDAYPKRAAEEEEEAKQ